MGIVVVITLMLAGLFAGGVSHQITKKDTSLNQKPSVALASKDTPVQVPTPALLPGIVVFLGSVLRKQKKEN